MFPYPFGPVYGGSVYNPSTGAESRDLRPLSPDDPRYGQRVPGALGGMGGDGSFGPVPETGGITPLPFGESGPVTFLTRPAQQFQQGRFPDRLAQKEADRQMQNITWENPNSSIQRIPGTMDFYHKDPITGRITRGTDSLDQTQSNTGPTNMPSRQPGRDPFTNLFGQIFGGSNYNPATGTVSRDIRPLSPDDPRYGQPVPGALGALGALNALAALGGGMRPTNKLPPGYGQDSSEPFAVSGGMTGGVMRPPGDSNYVPPIADDSGMYPSPVKPAVMPTPAPQYDFGRPQPRPDISVGGNQGMQQRPSRNPSLGYNPFMGGGLGPLQNPFMGGGGFNPFMGGGYGGGFNPFMGGGGFNPFMGGGGFNPFMGGGFGRQMNPFMGGGFGGGFGGGNMGGGYGNMGGGLGGF